jgi:hypothetical protein
MRSATSLLAVSAFALAACSTEKSPSSDAALQTDLSLAAQAHPAMRVDSISTVERTAASSTPGLVSTTPRPTQVAETAPAPAHHTTPVHHTHRSSSSQTASSSGRSSDASMGSAPIDQPTRSVEVKNTKRDAAIGAASGAILGGVVGHGGVKGGIVGGVVGGILGGVIGNNVDKHRRPVP